MLTLSAALVGGWALLGAGAGGLLGWLACRRELLVPTRLIRLQAVVTAVLFALLAARLGRTPVLLAPSWAAAVGTALAVLDLRYGRLPNWLTLPSYLVLPGLAVIATVQLGASPGVLGRAVLCMGVMGGLYTLVAMARPGLLGGGDVKLAGSLAFLLAWQGASALYAGTLLTWLLAASALLVRGLTGRISPDARYPAGHYMIGAALTIVLLHPWDPALLLP